MKWLITNLIDILTNIRKVSRGEIKLNQIVIVLIWPAVVSVAF